MRSIVSFLKHFEKDHRVWFLVLSLVVFILLRIPSLIEPYWYGDEGIYQVIGMAMREGRLLYRDIWDNKPPLLYVFYALFNGDLFSVKLLSLVFGVGSVVVFYLLAKKLFQRKYPIYCATLLFAILFGLPFLEGNIANAENFMLFPTLVALYLIFTAPEISSRRLFIAGLFLSASFLIKIVAIFDLAALLCYLLLVKYMDSRNLKHFLSEIIASFQKSFTKKYSQELQVLIAFIMPIALVALFFLLQGAFVDFLTASLLANIGYVGYGNSFLFPHSLLVFKIILLAGGIILTFLLRKQLGREGLLIWIWTLFSLFSTFFSQRPYTHYILVSLPAICLLVGYAINTQKMKIETVAFLAISLIVLLNFFHPYKKNILYYKNYLEFVMGEKTVFSYQAFFDRITPRDYHIAEFINRFTSPAESVFLWSDSGQIYALSDKLPPGRFIVAYHVVSSVNGIEETQQSFAKNPPKYIIATKDTMSIDRLLNSYELKYMIENARVYERHY